MQSLEPREWETWVWETWVWRHEFGAIGFRALRFGNISFEHTSFGNMSLGSMTLGNSSLKWPSMLQISYLLNWPPRLLVQRCAHTFKQKTHWTPNPPSPKPGACFELTSSYKRCVPGIVLPENAIFQKTEVNNDLRTFAELTTSKWH